MSTPARPLVVVLVGTDHHPFERLVGWVSRLADERPEWDWFVQHGSTTLPANLRGAPMLTGQELDDLMTRADVVVTHGGPGLIMESRAHGHVPVVVARDPSLGEHVDMHQQRFVARLGRASAIHEVRIGDDLAPAIEKALLTDLELTTATTGVLAERVGALVDALVPAGRRDGATHLR